MEEKNSRRTFIKQSVFLGAGILFTGGTELYAENINDTNKKQIQNGKFKYRDSKASTLSVQ